MKKWFKYFVYLSIFFLVTVLYRADYLKIPSIITPSALMISLLFLFSGFIIESIIWKQLLIKAQYDVGFYECLAGNGLSIFGKYLPGKVWMIIGRAAYLVERKALPLSELSIISLEMQFIYSWFGLIFGAIGLFCLGGLHIWGWLILFLWLGLTAVIFSNVGHSSAEYLIKKTMEKSITVPKLSIQSTIELFPWFILNWAIWSISFYYLVSSLSVLDVSPTVGLGFPLAITLGVMALITPGGLGTREGVMVGYLMLVGFALKDATTISVVARLWFLCGEIFIFIAGVIADRCLRRS